LHRDPSIPPYELQLFVLGLIGPRSRRCIAQSCRIFSQVGRMARAMGMFSNEPRIFALGGINASEAADTLDTAEVYVEEYNCWAPIAALPEPRHYAGAVAVAGGVLLTGGLNATNTPFTSTLWYEPVAGVWLPKPPLQTARSSHGCVAIGSKVYVLGGVSDDASDEELEDADELIMSVESISIGGDEQRWSFGTPMRMGRSFFGCAVLEGKIYVAGGCTSSGVTESVEVFDPLSNTWEEVASLHVARSECGMVALGRRLCLAGGTDAGFEETDAVELFDLDTRQWHTVAPLLSPLAPVLLCTLADQNKVYAVGHVLNEEETLDVYDVAADGWGELGALTKQHSKKRSAYTGIAVAVLRGR